MTTKTDLFWYDDLSILINTKRLTEFFPNKKLSLHENLNTLTRLALYTSILLIFYTKDIRWINIFVFALFFTYYLYHNESNAPTQIKSISTPAPLNETKTPTQKSIETFDSELAEYQYIQPSTLEPSTPEPTSNKKCTRPTIDNPFMNMTMKDYLNFDSQGNIIERPPACDTSDKDVKKEIDDNFKNNLYMDVNDLFGKFNSQRQFYTMPSTDIIPDINGEFKNWLYKSPKTCKEDQDYCLKYEDIRAKVPIN